MEAIMQKDGFHNLGLKQTTYSNKILDFFLTFFGVLKAVFSLRCNDVLVLQYPIKKYYYLLCFTAKVRGAKIITLVHDLGAFRRKKLTPAQEIAKLSKSDVIIAHNPNMEAWLRENGFTKPIVLLGIWDYLGKQTRQIVKTKMPTSDIHFIGDLHPSQNAFLYLLSQRLSSHHLRLIGSNFQLDKAGKGTVYMGFRQDCDLMSAGLNGWGLSWYGEALDTGIGRVGEYMQINNPHKVSLYLRCHLPIIIWEKAGLAQFVLEHGIGICIDSLENIENAIAAVSEVEYKAMRERVNILNNRIKHGYYFRNALQHAMEHLA